MKEMRFLLCFDLFTSFSVSVISVKIIGHFFLIPVRLRPKCYFIWLIAPCFYSWICLFTEFEIILTCM